MAGSANRSPPPAERRPRPRPSPAAPACCRCPPRSYELPVLPRTFYVADAACAQLRVARVRTDIRAPVPAAHALGIGARLREDPHAAAAGVDGRHRCRGSQRGLVHLRVRGDQEETQLLAEGREAPELL